jgi:hypothetical protein
MSDKSEIQLDLSLDTTISEDTQQDTPRYIPISTFTKITLFEADQWLVDMAKESGLDIKGFEHQVTSHFINHAIKEQSNEKREDSQGQIALTEEDFDKISEVLKKPDLVMIGAKNKNRNKTRDIIAYSKKFPDNTTLYFEEVLDGRKNKSLVSKTMFKRKNELTEEKFLTIVSGSNFTDISGAKIKSPRYTGDHPDLAATTKESLAAVNSTEPARLITILSSQAKKLSSSFEKILKKIHPSHPPL